MGDVWSSATTLWESTVGGLCIGAFQFVFRTGKCRHKDLSALVLSLSDLGLILVGPIGWSESISLLGPLNREERRQLLLFFHSVDVEVEESFVAHHVLV